jgi:WD40 repeat protein
MAEQMTTQDRQPAGDFMEIGKEVVPGIKLRCICRGHTDTIGRIAWSPCGRFIASPSEDNTIRI